MSVSTQLVSPCTIQNTPLQLLDVAETGQVKSSQVQPSQVKLDGATHEAAVIRFHAWEDGMLLSKRVQVGCNEVDETDRNLLPRSWLNLGISARESHAEWDVYPSVTMVSRSTSRSELLKLADTTKLYPSDDSHTDTTSSICLTIHRLTEQRKWKLKFPLLA